MDRSIFICPVCSTPLTKESRLYSCANSHSYDISKEGYVNLLLANQKQSREPGDSKEMLDARRSFLNKGYYKPLARSAASIIIKHRRHSRPALSGVKLTYCQRRSFILRNDQYNSGPMSASYSSHRRPEVRTISVSEPAPITGQVPVAEPVEVPDFNILDAGCGEGYYTDYISRNRLINGSSSVYGIDISKEGIRSAAKRNNTINFAVAGIYNLPVADRSVDTLLNIFAPFNEEEFGRVLKGNGIIISVTPGADHLFQLKRNLYDEVYLNDEEFNIPDRFHIKETIRLKYELNIHGRTDISNLLKMTPYYHKSSPERIESFLSTADHLKTAADFIIRIMSVS